MSKIISQGAEAIIIFDEKKNTIIKERIEKRYRIKQIDVKLRKYRTRRESRLLKKCKEIGLNVPDVIRVDDENFNIEMEYIKGNKLRDIIDDSNFRKFAKKIGEIISKLHKKGIIHHDLTTSNFLWNGKKLYLIDFGLSFYSHKIEDKAVDLHLLKRALESKHPEIYEKFFKEIINNYTTKDKEKILKRLNEIELRGRYKQKNKKK